MSITKTKVVLFKDIPVGTHFRVVEKHYEEDDYFTKENNNSEEYNAVLNGYIVVIIPADTKVSIIQ